MSEIKIALLLGGVSPESAVSKETSQAIYNALLDLNYDVKLIDPGYGIEQPTNPDDFFLTKDFKSKSVAKMFEAFHSDLFNDIDLVLIGLHGDWGEDGRIQSILEMRNLKYTGSGVLASSLAMDKAKTKIHLKHNNIPTADWFVVKKDSYNLKEISKFVSDDIGIPFIVKPNTGGSSVGLSLCKSIDELEQALSYCFESSNDAIIEKYIEGRELTVAILGEEILPVLEIKPKKVFYDYEAKYTDGMSEYEVPAKIDSEVAKNIQNDAMKAFKAIGCKTYSRVDFLLDKNNNYYCLEINTLPGMTSHSLVPKAAACIGINFNSLVEKIISLTINNEKK